MFSPLNLECISEFFAAKSFLQATESEPVDEREEIQSQHNDVANIRNRLFLHNQYAITCILQASAIMCSSVSNSRIKKLIRGKKNNSDSAKKKHCQGKSLNYNCVELFFKCSGNYSLLIKFKQ